MAKKMKDLVPRLAKRGPHRVLVGDLAFAGLPGKVYTPAEGKAIPGVAFGHDWCTRIDGYHATLRHLASWGIAVAAPDTENGVFPNHRGFASDLESCLQILAGVRLGTGNITVSPHQLYTAGHGMGGGAAILTGSGRTGTRAQKGYATEPALAGVIPIYPSDTTPSCYDAAERVTADGLIFSPGKLGTVPGGDAARVAARWGGDMIYRRVDKGSAPGFQEKIGRRLLLGTGLPEWSRQDVIRALMTGFILAGQDKTYAAFREADEKVKGTTTFTREELTDSLPENADLARRAEKVRL
ncbi:alpha/beta hydrolase [Corynebacterium bovis]|nr:alpha/beta hydrolase [Corynebacterium bovis]